jgi:hypothetical protein
VARAYLLVFISSTDTDTDTDRPHMHFRQDEPGGACLPMHEKSHVAHAVMTIYCLCLDIFKVEVWSKMSELTYYKASRYMCSKKSKTKRYNAPSIGNTCRRLSTKFILNY